MQTAPEGLAGAGHGTVSPDEIARFGRIAEQWWDPRGDFRPLHQLNPVRVGYVRDHVARHVGRDPAGARPLDGLDVVDIGCGGGLATESLHRLGARIVGIDASEESIAVARLHAQGAGLDIEYRCAAPEDLLARAERFDVVVSLEVIEHVADVDAFLAACAGLLRPGGAIVLSTLNRTVRSLLLAKIGAEYVLRWLPIGTHDWRKFIRPSELAAALRRRGLDLRDVSGTVYDPLRGAWWLDRDLSINYMAFATKP